jgi:hypothetical protein
VKHESGSAVCPTAVKEWCRTDVMLTVLVLMSSVRSCYKLCQCDKCKVTVQSFYLSGEVRCEKE